MCCNKIHAIVYNLWWHGGIIHVLFPPDQAWVASVLENRGQITWSFLSPSTHIWRRFCTNSASEVAFCCAISMFWISRPRQGDIRKSCVLILTFRMLCTIILCMPIVVVCPLACVWQYCTLLRESLEYFYIDCLGKHLYSILVHYTVYCYGCFQRLYTWITRLLLEVSQQRTTVTPTVAMKKQCRTWLIQ